MDKPLAAEALAVYVTVLALVLYVPDETGAVKLTVGAAPCT
jgi:hypothetical protein